MSNLINIIKEELFNFLSETYRDVNNLTIADLAEISKRTNGQLSAKMDMTPFYTKMLTDAYRKKGDQGVIDTFTQLNKVEIFPGVRRGRYSFQPMHTPDNYEGHLEESPIA